MKRIRNGRDRRQLTLEFDSSPRDEAELLVRLRELGLPGRFERVRLTRNRTVMVSFSGSDLRVHEGYLGAPRHVHAAVVTFVAGRTRAERRAAREAILAQPVERLGGVHRRAQRTRDEDLWLVDELQQWHQRYNALHFGGLLRPVNIRVSRRMQSRLGHYTAAMPRGDRAEIAISHAHIERHGWEETLHTLLHEMVHQWQDERGHSIDHGATFRQQARMVGITPSARRTVRSRRRRGIPEAPPTSLGLRAARNP